ncbi:MAG: tRNA lysidine(34) synthetase TilS [Bacillota bacterium]|nr:tRNA lysidine(34) synthetase TilS [Bacillota bacterium]
MEKSLINKVIDTITKNSLFSQGDTVIVGISGGPDSVCLVHALHYISLQFSLKVIAVHINHMLRGEEADLDESYALELCRELSIPFYSDKIDVRRMAIQESKSLEEAGRIVRYKQFEFYADKFDAQKIAVAHNRNDQVETVLMNIIRGTGLDGLKGIQYKRGRIVRPLLDIDRQEIEKYCKANNLSPRIDSSNLQNSYTRNKIRLELIPFINERFNSDLTGSLLRTSEIIRDDLYFIEEYTDMAFDKCVIEQNNNKIVLNIKILKDFHNSIKNRIVRLAIKRIKGNLNGIEKKHIDGLIELGLAGRTGSKISLPCRLQGEKSYDQLKISLLANKDKINDNNGSDKEEIPVTIPGVTEYYSSGAFLEAEIIERNENINKLLKVSQNSYIQYFDYEKLKTGIYLRNRKDGDYFKPYNGNGQKKLKEYFIDSKVPRDERDRKALIAIGKEVVWIIGSKTSDKFKVNENTKYILKLEFKNWNM